jgi:hypothetical protein
MTYSNIQIAATTLTVIDRTFEILETAAEGLDIMADYARRGWEIAKPILIATLMVAIALAVVAAFKSYELGEAFRVWCDRLVTESEAPVVIAGLLSAVVEPEEDLADVYASTKLESAIVEQRAEWEGMTRKQLIAFAIERDVAICKGARINEIIEVLEAEVIGDWAPQLYSDSYSDFVNGLV